MWPAPRCSRRLTWREAEHRRGSAGGGWGLPPPGGRARRGGLGGGAPHPRDWDPKRRSPPDSESQSLREVRFRAPGALLLEPEPRCPLPAPRASSPGPATGSSIRCSAGAAAIPRAAAAAAPLRPGGAAHPPSLPRTARRGSAPGPRPEHRPV